MTPRGSRPIDSSTRSLTTRLVAFAAICLICLGGVGAYTVFRTKPSIDEHEIPALDIDLAAVSKIASQSHLLFRSTALDRAYGSVSLIPLNELGGSRAPTALRCERVHYAAGLGVCLAAKRGMITSYRVDLFDDSYQVRQTLPLAGIPSRARVAPNGALVAFTSFVSGDSYAAAGFSTRTVLVEPASGRSLGDLEQFEVWRGDSRFQAADFNFWGVTFANTADRFYATLATGGKTYLVEGSASRRSMRSVRDDIECPALSPDNRRVAFKRRQPGIRVLWRIHVLDLETGNERAVAETRSVDDQVEWLDDATIIYALPRQSSVASASMDVWSVPSDGTGTPAVLLSDAESPSVIRR